MSRLWRVVFLFFQGPYVTVSPWRGVCHVKITSRTRYQCPVFQVVPSLVLLAFLPRPHPTLDRRSTRASVLSTDLFWLVRLEVAVHLVE